MKRRSASFLVPSAHMHFPRRVSLRIVGALLVAGIACSSDSDAVPATDYAGVVAFDTSRLRIVTGHDTSALTVELAETNEQRTMGLMERRSLDADAGMLFIYPTVQADSSAFWMFRTRIPLDIAFIDSAGGIRTIQTMAPCPSPLIQGCPGYPAGARFLAALEANAGYFAKKQIRPGDRVILQDTATRRRAARPPTSSSRP